MLNIYLQTAEKCLNWLWGDHPSDQQDSEWTTAGVLETSLKGFFMKLRLPLKPQKVWTKTEWKFLCCGGFRLFSVTFGPKWRICLGWPHRTSCQARWQQSDGLGCLWQSWTVLLLAPPWCFNAGCYGIPPPSVSPTEPLGGSGPSFRQIKSALVSRTACNEVPALIISRKKADELQNYNYFKLKSAICSTVILIGLLNMLPLPRLLSHTSIKRFNSGGCAARRSQRLISRANNERSCRTPCCRY